MKKLFALFWLSLVLFCGMAQANTPTSGDVKRGFIVQLEEAGILSKQGATTARALVTPSDDVLVTSPQSSSPTNTLATKDESTWTKYISWFNFLKIVGVILLLVAFHGMIMNIIGGIWHLIVAVPVEAYQATAIALVAGGLYRPDIVYQAQSFYVVLFCAFALPMLLGWVLATHDALTEALEKLFNIGIPISCLISAYACAYFAFLAFAYNSQVFGFFAVVGFSGALSFGLSYRPGVLTLEFSEPALPHVVIGHLLILIGYVVASTKGVLPASTELFKAGIEYYATIALGTALLTGSSPWYNRNYGIYSILLVVVSLAGTFASHVLGFPVIGNILIVFFVLFALEWLMYWSFSTNVIIGCLVTGLALFITSVFFEQYGPQMMVKLSSS